MTVDEAYEKAKEILDKISAVAEVGFMGLDKDDPRRPNIESALNDLNFVKQAMSEIRDLNVALTSSQEGESLMRFLLLRRDQNESLH